MHYSKSNLTESGEFWLAKPNLHFQYNLANISVPGAYNSKWILTLKSCDEAKCLENNKDYNFFFFLPIMGQNEQKM